MMNLGTASERLSESRRFADISASGLSTRTRGIKVAVSGEHSEQTGGRTSKKSKTVQIDFVGRKMIEEVAHYQVRDAEFASIDDLLLSYSKNTVIEAVLKYDADKQVQFEVESVLNIENDKALVKFVGYPAPFNDWVTLNQGSWYRGFDDAVANFKALQIPDSSKKTWKHQEDAGNEHQASEEKEHKNEKERGDFLDEFMELYGGDEDEQVDSYIDSFGEDGDLEGDVFDMDQGSAKKKREVGGGRLAIPHDNVEEGGDNDGDWMDDFDDEEDYRRGQALVRRGDSRSKKTKRGSLESDEKKSSAASKKKFKKEAEKKYRSARQGSQRWLTTLIFDLKKGSKGSYICKLCGGEKRSPNNESNLVTHMKSRHEKVWKGLGEANKRGDAGNYAKTLLKSREISSSVRVSSQSSLSDWLHEGEVSKAARTKIAFLIWALESQLAYHVFDSRHFARFKETASLQLDSAYLMKNATSVLYSVVVGQATAILRACAGVSVTGDLWTSLAGHKYLVLTYHGLTRNFESVHHALDLIPFAGEALGSLIGQVIEGRVAIRLGEDRQAGAVVFDSGANMIKASKSMSRTTKFHPCFAHGVKGVVDIVFGDAPKSKSRHLHAPEVACDMRAVKLIANVLRTTNWLRAELKEQTDLTLIIENITRWEGKYKAVSRFIALKKPLMACESLVSYVTRLMEDVQNDLPRDVLKPSFFARLGRYNSLLEALHSISKKSQAEENPSICEIPSWIWYIEKCCDDGTVLGHTLKKAIRERLHSKYLKADSLALQAALLNPRYVSQVLEETEQEIVEEAWNYLVQKAMEMGTSSSEDEEQEELTRNILLSSRKVLIKSMGKWLDQNPNGTVLQFWRDARSVKIQQNYCDVAAYYLSIPATGAPSERTFSSTTGSVTKKRNRLGDELLEKITVCRDFIRQSCYKYEDIVEALKDVILDGEDGDEDE